MAGGEIDGEGVRQQLADAVARTMAAGSAHVVITAESHMGDWPGDAAVNDFPPLEGVVDFAADRCRFQGGEAQMVMDGGTTYQRREEGRWTQDNGGPGQWSGFHPRWPLEVIGRAAVEVVQQSGPDGARFDVLIDRERASEFTYAGLAPDWDVTAQVELDSAGRIAHVNVALRAEDEDGQYAMDSRFAVDDVNG